MRRAEPDQLKEGTVPLLEARLTRDAVRELFPVPFEELDPLAEAEPALGTLVQLDSGELFHVTYGRQTGTLLVHIPRSTSPEDAFSAFLREVSLEADAITWRSRTSSQEPPVDSSRARTVREGTDEE